MLLGLALAKIAPYFASLVWAIAAILTLPLCIKKRAVVAFPAAIVAGLLLGLWQGSAISQQLTSYNKFIDQKVIVRGQVSDDAVYAGDGQLDFRLLHVQVNGHPLPGQVRIKSIASDKPQRGDTLQATGTLRDGFGPYQAAIYFATTQTLAPSNDPINDLRHQFAASIYTNIPEPQASLGLGFLLGLKSQLPDGLTDQLQILGLTHIVVASGYNVTILVRVARRLLQKRSKFQTVVVAVGLMAGFVMVTGFSASMTRAALVTSLALAAWYYGRTIHPVTILLVAASATAMVNPLFLWSDLGWWLSFLAFAGVMLLAPLIQHRMFGPDAKPKLVGQVVLETISAQILTLPIIVCIFGNVAVLAVVANVLIVPLIPLAMLATFAGGLVGLFVPSIAAYVALPATWLLTYITEVARLMASIPWASMSFSIAVPVMIASYAAMALIGWILWRKTKHNYLNSSVID